MYLTATQAESRLQTRYSISAELTDGHVEAGSNALDELAPFETPLEDYETLPDALLDYVALYAYMLACGWRGAVVRDSMQPFSTVYAKPEPNKHAKVARELVGRHIKRTGVRV